MSRLDRLSAAPDVDPVLGVAAGPTFFPGADPVQAGRDAANALLPAPEPVEPPRRKKKVGGWNDYPENYERIRRAWYATRALPDGFESISDMIATVLMRQAEEWEREHNGGEPFPDTGKVRHSRRT